ncbi:hypothetical protein [Streptomyces sp. NPDC094468]|uniref:hypothetical protein n=1 Tax=Streptomyces sp. NPDC094468 TaxID=3366066 RepID=UPI00382536A4
MPAESLLPAVQLAATAGLIGWMTTGFTYGAGRWMRYPLFARGTFVIISLTGTKDGTGEPINPYTYLSPGAFLLPPPQLQAIVTHLIRTGRYDRIDGTGRVLSVKGEQRIEVTDGRVVL